MFQRIFYKKKMFNKFEKSSFQDFFGQLNSFFMLLSKLFSVSFYLKNLPLFPEKGCRMEEVNCLNKS